MTIALAKPRHFTDLAEWGAEGLDLLAERALAFKRHGPFGRPLAGRTVAYCFFNPSLRTQVSFEAATAALGGHPVTLFLGSGTWKLERREGAVMDGDAAEHVKEAVPVLGKLCAAVGLRCFPEGRSWEEDRRDPWISAFRRHSSVPVINLESSLGHPCQALGDYVTLKERMDPRGKKFLLAWAPHVKPLPLAVPHSAAEMAALAGMDVCIARPPGFDLDRDAMGRIAEQCRARGASLTLTDDPGAAFDGAHVVYAKSWGSLAAYGRPLPAEPEFRARWMVDDAKLRRTDGAVFMHCLPVRRNLVVADSVLDGPRSIVVEQAGNRLYAAMAVLAALTENP